jgi:hypothetical protein
MDSKAFKDSSKVEAYKSRRIHAGSITTSKSFAVTNQVYSGNGVVARPFSTAE